jgi:hypothetical protein
LPVLIVAFGMTVGYVAYIDESGEEGLRQVRPLHPGKSSEWFILSAFLVKVHNDKNIVQWLKAIPLKNIHQRTHIHYRDLSPPNRRRLCEGIAKLPSRCFVVMSNKKNMQGHKNPNAEKFPAQNWFYCWITRLLLERVTGFCASRAMRDWNETRTVRLIISTRGGMSYGQLRAYLYWIREQSKSGKLYLSQGDLDWSVVNIDDIHPFDHSQRAGLQIADAVASAFYEAVECWPRACEPAFAKLLKPRMARSDTGQILEYGIKPMPALRKARLNLAQREIFEFYGFPPTKW